MALLSAAKRLFIPQKTSFDPKSWLEGMRTLENFNPINKLVAGSGVTLNPADGSGPEVEISSSGGGGGSSVGMLLTDCGMESLGDNTDNNGGIFLGVGFDQAFPNTLTTYLISPNGTVGANQIKFGFAWAISNPGTGGAISLLPKFYAPDFTGATDINISAVILGAMSTDNTNQAKWVAEGPFAIPSGGTYQTLNTDFTNEFINGTDTGALAAGSGDSGNGIVSNGANLTYLGSMYAIVDFTGATFT